MNPKTTDKPRLHQRTRNSETLVSLAPRRHGGASRAPGPGRQRRQAAWEAAGGPGSCVLSVWVTSTASQSLQCGIWAPGLDLLPEHGPTSSRVHSFMA